jgi:hypothetical protein
MSRDSSSQLPIDVHVPREAPMRAKSLRSPRAGGPRRLSTLRIAGRAEAARMLSRAVEETGTNLAQCASTLGLSREHFGAMADPSKPAQLCVGDIIALSLSGRRVAIVYVQDLLDYLEQRARRLGYTREQHLRALSSALGRLASSMEGPGQEAYVAALRGILARVREALTDCGAGSAEPGKP